MQLSMFLSEEPRASRSAWPDYARDWLIRAETSPSPSLQSLTDTVLAGSFGRTCPVSCRVTEDGILVPSSEAWGNSGMGGPTGSWTLTVSEFPHPVVASSLLDVWENGPVPRRFYLSPRACTGILRRMRKGNLSPAFMRVWDTSGGPISGSEVVSAYEMQADYAD